MLGSVARGDACPDSDIDIMVITGRPLRRSQLMERIPKESRDARLSLLPVSEERWKYASRCGSLFVHHALLEGVSLYDPHDVLQAGFRCAASKAPDVDREVERQLAKLRLYRDPRRLNGQHLFALSHVYAIGKAIVIARCTELGNPTFVKDEAFQRLTDLRPGLAPALQLVAGLRPFYDLTHGRERRLPFDVFGAEEELGQAIEAVKQIAHG